MAIRSLADESRCLSLMSRYESRLQRCHDKAYVALRELQQLRTPPSPDPAITTESPSVSAGITPSKTISPNEPSTPAPKIHLCTPVGQVPDLPIPPERGNSENNDK